MPEIGEVARIVHYLRKHIVGKTIKTVDVQEDNIVYGKAGTTAAEFKKAMTGNTVVDVGQQGKYFWLVMESRPHPLMHFGMAGWIEIKGDSTGFYKPTNAGKEKDSSWPPKYWKFALETEGEGEAKSEVAFVDFRRLSRIRLIDCEGDGIRKVEPLSANGPDPIIDKHILTKEWLTELLRRKKLPVKALLLDQANISGIGNWVGDEILYHAKIHPEQYSNTLTAVQVDELHSALLYVSKTAVDLLADSSQFPDDWLFKYRWNKGKRGHPQTLPNGEKVTYLRVGGRTSAIVASIQKKTGPISGEEAEEKGADDEKADEDTAKKPLAIGQMKKKKMAETSRPRRSGRGKKRQADNADAEGEETKGRKDGIEEEGEAEGAASPKIKRAKGMKSKISTDTVKKTLNEEPLGLRRSARLKK